VPGAETVNVSQSGRLELAKWLTSPKNPLTARVLVNRVWAQLFGRGLVSTVDNFGVNGDVPSHPELLDFLANRFVAEGWSIKKLVRELVLTRAYCLSSDVTDANRLVDPSNRFVWRHSPRRLSAEEIRDGMLLAAGVLDPKRPGASPANELKMVEMRDNGPEAATINTKANVSTHRSVYLPLLRGVTPHALEAFDPVEQSLVTGTRDATTVPGQALFLLNSNFVRKQSLVLAEKLLAEKDASDANRLEAAYRRALGRSPSEKELDRARTFLGEYESTYREAAPPKPTFEPKPVPKKKAEVPANPDEIDQTGESNEVDSVRPKDARTAAWLALVQALHASAEFRYVR